MPSDFYMAWFKVEWLIGNPVTFNFNDPTVRAAAAITDQVSFKIYTKVTAFTLVPLKTYFSDPKECRWVMRTSEKVTTFSADTGSHPDKNKCAVISLPVDDITTTGTVTSCTVTTKFHIRVRATNDEGFYINLGDIIIDTTFDDSTVDDPGTVIADGSVPLSDNIDPARSAVGEGYMYLARFDPPPRVSQWAPSELPPQLLEYRHSSAYFKLFDGLGRVSADGKKRYDRIVIWNRDAFIALHDVQGVPGVTPIMLTAGDVWAIFRTSFPLPPVVAQLGGRIPTSTNWKKATKPTTWLVSGGPWSATYTNAQGQQHVEAPSPLVPPYEALFDTIGTVQMRVIENLRIKFPEFPYQVRRGEPARLRFTITGGVPPYSVYWYPIPTAPSFPFDSPIVQVSSGEDPETGIPYAVYELRTSTPLEGEYYRVRLWVRDSCWTSPLDVVAYMDAITVEDSSGGSTGSTEGGTTGGSEGGTTGEGGGTTGGETGSGEGGTAGGAPLLALYYSGADYVGAPQGDPNKSLGGHRSGTKIPVRGKNILFDDIGDKETSRSTVEYRAIFLRNDGTAPAQNIRIWISQQPHGFPSQYIALSLAKEGKGDTIMKISSEKEAPSGQNFVTPSSHTDAIVIPQLLPNEAYGIWVKRVSMPGERVQRRYSFAITITLS